MGVRLGRYGHQLAAAAGICLLLGAAGVCAGAAAVPGRDPSGPDAPALREIAARLGRRAADRYAAASDLLAAGEGPQGLLNRTAGIALVGLDRRGRPHFLNAHNLNAARTVGADLIWPGGASGLGLDGANEAGELGIWDVGAVRADHVEFGGRAVQVDGYSYYGDHATHVAGTMIAAGVDPLAKGLAPAASLSASDWLSDSSEMAASAAAGMLVSNHSYGVTAGWYKVGSPGVWYWFGDPAVDPAEDHEFGFYGEKARDWDQVAWNAPGYLIVKSAGNDRDDQGPSAGQAHYVYSGGQWIQSTVARDPDGGETGFDTIAGCGNAKNVLTVGAVHDIPGGYAGPQDVLMADFSSWGPTDDGRVKPDLVADGVGVWSASSGGATVYAAQSGTSCAAPAVSAVAGIIAGLLADVRGERPAAATVKAVLIHTADEAGDWRGPDYRFGWGLADAAAAAGLAAGDQDAVREGVLAAGRPDTLHLVADGTGPVLATVCWTDPPGECPPEGIDPADRILVNDLDLKLVQAANGIVALPWVLDPAAPDFPAMRGDNDRDNVEQVYWGSPAPGEYLAIVAADGALAGGSQAYSLVVTGAAVRGTAPRVANLDFAQGRDGGGLVQVSFDLEDPDSPEVAVSISASGDGGATWDLKTDTVSGDVGPGVAVGSGKTIVWDFAADNPGVFGPECVVRVVADDGS